MAKKGKAKSKAAKAAGEPSCAKGESETVEMGVEKKGVDSVPVEGDVDEKVCEEEVVVSTEEEAVVAPQRDSEVEELVEKVKRLEKELETKTERAETSEELLRQLETKTAEAQRLQDNYNNLLSKVSAMKTLFTKMKAAETELEESKRAMKAMEEEKSASKREVEGLRASVETLRSELESVNSECQRLQEEQDKSRREMKVNASELDVEVRELEAAKRSLELDVRDAKDRMEEQVVLLQEERVRGNALAQELGELRTKCANVEMEREQLMENQRKGEDAISQLKSQVAELGKAKQDLERQAEYQKETGETEIVRLQGEINVLRRDLDEKNDQIKAMETLEEDLKQKQLQLGKLRHENIKTNEHLSKAMKLLKRNTNAQTVDRDLVSNLFINFLQLDRGDSKKFEVLQLIAGFLDWDDDRRRHAGLLGGSRGTQSNSVVDVPTPRGSQSFVNLWTEFLEKESTPQV